MDGDRHDLEVAFNDRLLIFNLAKQLPKTQKPAPVRAVVKPEDDTSAAKPAAAQSGGSGCAC